MRLNLSRLSITLGHLAPSPVSALKVVPSRQGHQVPQEWGSRSSATTYMENSAPKSSHAEKSRTLAKKIKLGVLSTTHQALDYPYGSTVNITVDELGRPYMFVSTMAEHTANLLNNPKASVLVTEVQGAGDQLAQARITLVGDMVEVPKTAKLIEDFMKVHPAAYYIEFNDFKCFRMDVKHVRYIGGFGEMSWVKPEHYGEAEEDIVAIGNAHAIEHMNQDHMEHTLLMVKSMGGMPDATEASVLNIDRYGFDVLAETPTGKRRSRIGWLENRKLQSGDEVRWAMVDLTNKARELLGIPVPEKKH